MSQSRRYMPTSTADRRQPFWSTPDPLVLLSRLRMSGNPGSASHGPPNRIEHQRLQRGLYYIFATYTTTVDFGNGIVTAPTAVNVVLLSIPTSPSPFRPTSAPCWPIRQQLRSKPISVPSAWTAFWELGPMRWDQAPAFRRWRYRVTSTRSAHRRTRR